MYGIVESWLGRARHQRPAGAHPDAGRYDPAWTEQRAAHVPPLPATPPVDPEHAEREAAAIRGATGRQPAEDTAAAAAVLEARSPRVAGGYATGGPVPAPAGYADEARRGPDWPEPPDYGRPPTRTGELLLKIDEEIAGSLARRNQVLRRDFATAVAELGREQLLRKTAETQRDTAQARVADLELTVGALGEKLAATEKALVHVVGAIRHAIGHEQAEAH